MSNSYKFIHSKLFFSSILIVCFSIVVKCDPENTCDKEGLIGSAHGISCQVIDHAVPDQYGVTPSSFDCIDTLVNSIVVHKDGDITLECFAKFPIELDYDGVQPAIHFEVEFSKRDVGFNFTPEESLYVISLWLDAKEDYVIWSANYIFHAVGETNEILMMSVFVEKTILPFFLPLGDETIKEYLHLSGKYVIIPCRVQNYDAKVELIQDYIPVEMDETIVFDPKIGFERLIVEDVNPYGEYECYVEQHGKEDRQKVVVNESPVEEVTPEVTTAETKDHGQLKFIKGNDGQSMGMCLITKQKHRKTKAEATFVNAGFNNPGTFKIKAGCLHDLDEKTGRMCPGRKIGKKVNLEAISITNPLKKLIPFENITEYDDLYEINPVHPSGGIQCGHNRRHYFTGTDDNIYYDYNVAVEKHALVQVEPSEHHERYVANGWYGFDCKFPTYITVLPVWWSMKFSDGTALEFMASNSSTKYFELRSNTIQIGCKVSAWNSSEWFEDDLDVHVVEPDALQKPDDTTKIYFKAGAKNQVLPCKASGKPKPSLSWLRNDETDEKLTTFADDDSLTLIFQTISNENEGNYTCVATSESVSIELKFNVVVLEEEVKIVPPKKKSDEKGNCVLVPILLNNNEEEIRDISSISSGDTVFVRILNNCSDKGFVIKLKAHVSKDDGKDEDIGQDKSNGNNEGDALEKPVRDCATIESTLRSPDNKEELKPETIEEGDEILINISERDCTVGDERITALPLSVTKVELGEEPIPSEEPWFYSKTALALAFALFCILIVILVAACAYYCMEKPNKVYWVNR